MDIDIAMKKFEPVTALAWWQLEHVANLHPRIPGPGIPRVRFWDSPGFSESEPMTLTAFEPVLAKADESVSVREVTWQSRIDTTAFYRAQNASHECDQLQPTISVRDATVPLDEFRRFLKSGEGIRVPLLTFADNLSVTTDAGSAGFDFYTTDQPPAVIRLEWSFEIPDELKPAVEWAGRFRDFLNQFFAK